MNKKLIIYISLVIVWSITCLTLYRHELINWIGILISFVFTLPTIIYDVIDSLKKENRNKKILAFKRFLIIGSKLEEVIRKAENFNNSQILAGRATARYNFQNEANKYLNNNEKEIKELLTTLTKNKKSNEAFNSYLNNHKLLISDVSEIRTKLNMSPLEKNIYGFIDTNR